MGVEPSSSHFTDIRRVFDLEFTYGHSSGSDPNSKECPSNNPVVVTAYPVGMIPAMNNNNGNGNDEDEGESRVEPHIGLEFDNPDDARDFYSSYAERIGFKIRTGQLYRSRTDGTVSSRRFVCSKEGFQLNSRTGCPALIKVQRRDSGKWVVDLFLKDHNHDLGISGESPPPMMMTMPEHKQKSPLQSKAMVKVSSNNRPRTKSKLIASGEDGRPSPSGIINIKRLKRDGELVSKVEPFSGLEFNSANEAYQFYQSYAASKGFRIRIGQLFRSKLDGAITSRRFVCSKEGFQHPSRLGCGAFMRIKRQESGKWVVDRLQKGHNHELEPQTEIHKKSFSASKRLLEEDNGGLENDEDIFHITNVNANVVKRNRENHIGSDWYRVLFEYFQNRQAEDMSFFYAADVDGGNCMSVFWADGRSRFSASQFGDAVILDTSYRKSIYLVPFATFIGINHHRQPVLLGCALIADESEESFSWLFQTWLKATSGFHPLSMIADQDKAIHQSIKKVFPRTHHRFSLWQLKAKETEYLNLVEGPIRYEYEKCVYQSQTVEEFETSWNAFINRYGLVENAWLKEMYTKRECWVPAYLRGTFFAGIPLNEGIEPFFGSFLNAQTPLNEFISRYERSLERRREEERKEDFNSYNLQAFMQTKEPMEEQCRRLYTLNVFKIFQKELLQSYSYLGFKVHEEVSGSRYLVRKGANDNEKCIVTFNASNLNVVCSCGMFEFEGLLCRHALRVLQILDIRDVPSRYVLHRWTRNAEHGTVHDFESARSSQELKGLMVWSLRETASKYIEAGATSFEKHKLAYEIMREGGRKLCWQR